jgi:hypothetical protein
MSKKKREARPTACVYPECRNTARSRGLCHAHYQGWRRLASRGDSATDEDLIQRGLLLPSGSGGSPVADFSGFQPESELLGRGGDFAPANDTTAWRAKWASTAHCLSETVSERNALSAALVKAVGKDGVAAAMAAVGVKVA